MRLTIALPADVWQVIQDMATAERRPPKYQVEHLLIEAVRSRQANDAREPEVVSDGR